MDQARRGNKTPSGIIPKLKKRFYSLNPKIQKPAIGFTYGFAFGSCIGLLTGIQHLGNEELRVGRRIVKMAKSGCTVGVMCGVIVSVGFCLR